MRSQGGRARGIALLAVLALLAAGCGASHAAKRAPRTAAAAPKVNYQDRPAIRIPTPNGQGSLGPIVDSERPTLLPTGAAESLQGKALPTNTWWTSALVGKYTAALWAFPVVARGGPDGLELSAPEPLASQNTVIASAAPALTVGGPLKGVTVTGYGDFSVDLSLQTPQSPLTTVIAQGSPFVPVHAPAGTLPITLAAATSVTDGHGADLAVGASLDSDSLVVQSLTQTWVLAASRSVTWRRTAQGIQASADSALTYVFSPVPTGGPSDWAQRTEAYAHHPVMTTASVLTSGAGAATQDLYWEGASGSDVIAVLPHQQALLGSGVTRVAGHYDTSRGELTLVQADALHLKVPLPGLLPGIPQIPLTASNRSALQADLTSDLAVPDSQDAGTYYGPKALGRLATMLQIARRIGDTGAAAAILAKLRPRLVDWFTYTGPSDKHWLAYDAKWGGIVGHPSEFGNADFYNDHHFQFGYLIAAAAAVAEADPTFAAGYGSVVDLLVDDIIGAGTGSPAAASFPPFRVFSAYEGHSIASGFTTVPDGDNQESTSEAVNAWAGIAQWGMVTNRKKLLDAAVTRYALEADSARTYWLGESGPLWPDAYAHDTVGIVWGGKVDFATFFDGRPESVIGIQLLPFTFASLYRTDPDAAAQRSATVAQAGGGTPREWPDLFLMDDALADPAAALAKFTPDLSIEGGNSRAFTLYWLLALNNLGRPRADIFASDPYGFAFGNDGALRLAAINPTGHPVTVTWRTRDGNVVGAVQLSAGEAKTIAGR
ncbi:MAG TPA: glycosyl hydrolase [Frankiaceae bacterium]|jgi:endoglucanase Acf2|nr:glycosyl hydrolase [Frankiaceae bacterium]